MLELVNPLFKLAEKFRHFFWGARQAGDVIDIVAADKSDRRVSADEFFRFIKFVFISIALPSLIGFALLEGIGWRNKLTTSPGALAAIQENDSHVVTVPSGGIPRYGAFKIARISELQPEVVYIGQSRCGEVRSEMFKPYRFYNACLSAWTFDQVTQMLDRIFLVSHPSIVIVEIDYFMFTAQYRSAWTSKATMNFSAHPYIDDLRIILSELNTHPIGLTIAAILGAKSSKTGPGDGLRYVGVDATRSSAGFRYDGSFQYPESYQEAGKLKNQNAAADFLSAVHGAPKMDSDEVSALKRLAEAGRKHNVLLVGMELPILKPVIDFLDHDENYRPLSGVWREFESDQTRRVIADLGITFFHMAKSPAAEDPRLFVDPAHPNEAGIARSMIDLSSDPAFVRVFPRIDYEQLRADYDSAVLKGRFFDMYGSLVSETGRN